MSKLIHTVNHQTNEPDTAPVCPLDSPSVSSEHLNHCVPVLYPRKSQNSAQKCRLFTELGATADVRPESKPVLTNKPWPTLLFHSGLEKGLTSAPSPPQRAPAWQKSHHPPRELNESRNKALTTEEAVELYPFQSQHLIPPVPMAAYNELLKFLTAAYAVGPPQAPLHSLFHQSLRDSGTAYLDGGLSEQ